jgi:MFS family permease
MNEPAAAPHRPLAYAWVIVASCSVMVGVTYGLNYSFAVFFKPLAAYFSWDRETVSLVYSVAMVFRGAVSIGTGWLADRYGARTVMLFCGALMGAGFLLSSRVTTLWQLFLTYGVVEAIGLSGTFGIVTAAVSRWFRARRGLALGIVASGSGVGTLLLVPAVERLVAAVDWSRAFVVVGIAAGVVMVAAAALLREPPALAATGVRAPRREAEGATVKEALRDPRMLLIGLAFLFFFFGIQIVMVHLVAHATDAGIDPLVAATFISVIGAASIAGRLAIGVGADRIGLYKTLLFTRVFLVLAFVLLLFSRSVWSFYVFAAVFSIPYGGEIPQIPLAIGRFFGTKAMATLMGFVVFVVTVGGALGPWVAGTIFDATGSYDWAFIAGALAAAVSLGMVLLLRRQEGRRRAA